MAQINWDKLGLGDKLSLGFSAGSLLTGILGNNAAANTEKYKLKSQALSLEHKKDMAELNAKMIDSQIGQIARAFDRQVMIKTMAAGQAISSKKTSFAARGVDLGVGSTANVFAGAEILKEIDKLTINSNKVRAIQQKRKQKFNLTTQASMAGVSSDNLFSTASTISPFLNNTSTLLSGGVDILKNLPEGFFSAGSDSDSDSEDKG